MGTYKEIIKSGIDMDALLTNIQNEERTRYNSINEANITDNPQVSLNNSLTENELNENDIDKIIASNQLLEISGSKFLTNVSISRSKIGLVLVSLRIMTQGH